MLVGSRGGQICELRIESKKIDIILNGHYNKELWGLQTHPVRQEYVSAGQDFLLCRWSLAEKRLISKRKLRFPAKCLAISPYGDHIAVGFVNGRVQVIEYDTLKVRKTLKCSNKEAETVKYSPDNKFLVVGSHSARIYVFQVRDDYKYKRLYVLRGHHSTITHLDFSLDSCALQSNCTSYEILFWNLNTGKQDTRGASSNRDEKWASWSCVLGWPVQGIYPPCSDGTDVNSVCRSKNGLVLATGDDFGKVKLFRYPALKKASYQQFLGHSSHVTSVKFTLDDQYLISAGGNDKTIFQWKHYFENEEVEYEEEDAEEEGEYLKLEEEPAEEQERGNGMFNMMEEVEGDQFMAVRAYKGDLLKTIPEDLEIINGMGDEPEENLSLMFVNGFRCFDTRNMAKLGLSQNEIIFATAALGVKMDVRTREQQFFNQHEDDVVSFCIDSTRRIAATGQMAYKGKSKFIDIFVWDIATMEVLKNLKGFHRRAVQLLKFSPDGSKLLTFGKDDDNSLAVYDWRNGNIIATSKVDKANVLDITFVDNNTFITGGTKHIKQWHLNGCNLRSQRVSFKALNYKSKPAFCLEAVSKSLAVAGSSKGFILSLRGGSVSSKKKWHDGSVQVMCFNKQSSTLYTGGNDGKVNQFSVSSGQLKHQKQVVCIGDESLRPILRSLDVWDNRMLLGTAANELFLYSNVQSKYQQGERVLIGHYRGELWGLACNNKNSDYVTCGDDKTVRLWDIEKRDMKGMQVHSQKLRACDFSPDGQLIVVASMKGLITLYNGALTGTLDEMQSRFKKRDQWIEEVKFSPQG